MAEKRTHIALPVQVSTITDFVLSVKYLPAAVLSDMAANAQADGTDIYFKTSGGTLLARDIIKWDADNEVFYCKVKIPSYASNFIYMYWGGDADIAARNTDVYRTAYRANMSLDEASGTLYDNTANNNDGTASGSPTYGVAGAIGTGLKLLNADSVDFGNGDSIKGHQTFDISIWVKGDFPEDPYYILGKTSGQTTNNEWQIYIASGALYLRIFDTTALVHIGRTASYIGRTTRFGDGAWHEIRFTYDGSGASSGVRIEIDRVRRDDTDLNAGVFTSIKAAAVNMVLGGGNNTFAAAYDEIKYFSEVRAAVEADAMHANDITNGQDWYAVGSIETARTVSYNANGGSGTITGGVYTDGLTVTVAANEFTRTGYTFSKFNTAADGSGTDRSPADEFVMGSSDVVLYAQWVASGGLTTVNRASLGLSIGLGL
jgi:YD repeat-containing protein